MTVVLGTWTCFVALLAFFGAGLMVSVLRTFTNRVAATSAEFEFARARLTACVLGLMGISITLLGLAGGSIATFLKAEAERWWQGPVTLLIALVLVMSRMQLAHGFALRPIPLLYRSLCYDERRQVAAEATFRIGMFLGWLGVILMVQIIFGISEPA